jgi:glycerophosphoryl diester phosphodiesterase
MTRKILLAAATAVTLFALFVYLNNATPVAAGPGGRPMLLAHRGLAQTFPSEGVKADTCTASRIHPPEHPWLENTLAAMEAAFRLGADMVELDIHPTTDGRLAVFHDWTLDCRTNGTGVTRKHSLADLKALDIGYGYTADGGTSFPFRGKGVGLMPALDEVLAAFPDRRFLIHLKSNEPGDGERLADLLGGLPPQRLAQLAAYGGDRPVAAVHERLPALRTMSKRTLLQCGLRYIAVGWSGHVPAQCNHSIFLVPGNYAGWLWGWPERLVERMRGADTLVFVLGPWDGDFSSGIDDVTAFRALPSGYSGGIWTNRIDRISALAAARSTGR